MSEKNENKTEKQLIGIEPEAYNQVVSYLLNKPLPFVETKPLLEALEKVVPVTVTVESSAQ